MWGVCWPVEAHAAAAAAGDDGVGFASFGGLLAFKAAVCSEVLQTKSSTSI